MWTPYCYMALLIVGATARSSGYFQLQDRIIWGTEHAKDSPRQNLKRTRDMDRSNNFMPVLTSGMNIQSDNILSSRFNNDNKNEEEIPNLSSGMNIPTLINKRDTQRKDSADKIQKEVTINSEMNNNNHGSKREVNNTKSEAPKTTTNGKHNNENLLSSVESKLDEKQKDLSQDTKEEENDDEEINVQVNVDTTAEVSTEIIKPNGTTGKDKKKGNKLIIKVNIKIKKDEPKPLEVAKNLFGEDYDQKTCDWLKTMGVNLKTDTTKLSG